MPEALEVVGENLAVRERAGPLREDLTPGLRDQHRVLELGRQFPVLRHRRPLVVEHLYFPRSNVDHRFDSERHARFQTPATAPMPDVADLRFVMELPPDAVTDEIAHHRAA